MLQVGFTGTQQGMTDDQKLTVRAILFDLQPRIVHHGDCVGADKDFHDICAAMIDSDQIGGAQLDTVIIGHPGTDSYGHMPKRAGCAVHVCMDPKPYLERNTDIVNTCSVLIATPSGFEEELRSGTWSTIRRARKRDIQVYVVWPDGSVN